MAGMVGILLGASVVHADVAAAQARPKAKKAPLDIALRLNDVPREKLRPGGYRAETRPDPWEELDGIGYDPDDTGVPRQRDPGTLPVDIGGLGGLLDGETIPLFRWRVAPPL